MATTKVSESTESTETTGSKTKAWIEKVDQSSFGELRKKYPKAFWIVGGVVLLSLIL